MNYQKIYDAIIAKARSEETIPGNYYERHHILPKCIGGGNEPENLVTLSARSPGQEGQAQAGQVRPAHGPAVDHAELRRSDRRRHGD